MKLISITTAALLSTTAVAEYKSGPFPKSLEEVRTLSSSTGESCQEQLEIGSRCILRNWDSETKDLFVEAYVFLPKADYSDHIEIAEIYLDFPSWPAYVEEVEGSSVIDFETSEIIHEGTDTKGNRTLVQYFKYAIKAPFPINKMPTEGTSSYTIFSNPAPGAIFSGEFTNTKEWGNGWPLKTPMPDGRIKGVGLVGQDANLHIVDAGEDYLVIYRTRAHPQIELLPMVSARVMEKALRDILEGLFPE